MSIAAYADTNQLLFLKFNVLAKRSPADATVLYKL